MGSGYRYVRSKKIRGLHDHKEPWKLALDKVILVIAVLIPIANIPQLLKIWVSKDAAGVSVVSWFAFSVFSVFWFLYGVVHKDKALIIMNFVLIILQALIAIGAFIYS